jgi:aspartyl protease family protein
MAIGFTGTQLTGIGHFSDIAYLAAVVLLLCLSLNATAASVTVVGLFPGKAVVVINNAPPRTISVGQKQAEDVTLISTASASAVFDIDGKRHTIDLGEHFAVPEGSAKGAASNTLTLSADSSGQFWTIGQINGKSVRFLVDTGASLIALPASAAKNMGIDYTKGQRGFSSTAGGVVPVYRVSLDAVTIGSVTLYQVDAAVLESGLDVALLGMSYLNRFEMKRDGAQMALTKRF